MRQLLNLTACLTLLYAGSAAVSGSPQRSVNLSRLEVARDPRVSRQVKSDAELCPLAQVASLLQKSTGLGVMIYGAPLRSDIMLPVRGRSSASVMLQVAELLGGEWFVRGDTVVLITTAARARLFGLEPEPAGNEPLRQLIRALSVRQWQELEGTSMLQVDALAPGQQAIIRPFLLELYFRSPDKHPSGMALGKGVKLALQEVKTGNTGNTRLLHVVVPMITNNAMLDPFPIVTLEETDDFSLRPQHGREQ